MRARDLIEIVEAAYSLEGSRFEWQERMTELVAKHWDGGAVSFLFDATTGFDRENLVASGIDFDVSPLEHWMRTPVPEVELARQVFCSAPHVASLAELMGSKTSANAQSSVEALPEIAHYVLGVRTLDPGRVGVLFSLRDQPVSDRARDTWGLIATHMSIGYRLHRALDRAAPPSGEAVLDLEGRCAHAEGEAKDAGARERLRDAARRVMRARGSLRRTDSAEALALWKGLVAGRWSLVDRFDSDGKHFLVAHKNPPEVRDRRALTAREKQVASYLAMGFTNKLIGYSLGIAASTAADHVASIGKKLGTSSRADLASLLAAFDGADEALDP